MNCYDERVKVNWLPEFTITARSGSVVEGGSQTTVTFGVALIAKITYICQISLPIALAHVTSILTLVFVVLRVPVLLFLGAVVMPFIIQFICFPCGHVPNRQRTISTQTELQGDDLDAVCYTLYEKFIFLRGWGN